jgi:hypothetical protein
MNSKHLLTVALATILLGTTAARADLVFEGSISLGGTGLGAVDTILTMTSHGNGTSESGRVSWNGTSNVVTPDPTGVGGLLASGAFTSPGSTDMTGINHTVLMSQTGWTPGMGLGIVFNPAEPGPVGSIANQITLNNLVLTVYGATTGTALFTAPWLGGPMTLAASIRGQATAGSYST